MDKDYDVLNDLRDHLEALLISKKIDPVVAKEAAVNMQKHFRKHWGGNNI